MNHRKSSLRLIKIAFCIIIFSLAFPICVSFAQTKPLSLAQILTGLQSKSGGFTLTQKNKFITEQVQLKGVTFKLTLELEKELRLAGATAGLIKIIRQKTSSTVADSDKPKAKPDAKYDRIWLEQDIVEKGVRGIRIYANFTVYNLKGIKSDIVYRFKKNGKLLKGKTLKYKTKSGDLSVRRYLLPPYSTSVYEETAAFIPYSEFNLARGTTHRIKMEAFVIKRNGTRVKHLIDQYIDLVMPSPTIVRSKGNASLSKMRVEYNVLENNLKGMRIHINMKLNKMQGETAYLRVLFSKNDGTPLIGLSPKYRTKGTKQTALFRLLKPKHISSRYNISMFIPYKEFGLPGGKYNLKMQADVVSASFHRISFLSYKHFSYNNPK